MNQVINIKGLSLLYYIVFFAALLSASTPLFLSLTPLSSLFIVFFSGLVALFSFSRTPRGLRFLSFASEAQRELRKVTWPSKQETKKSVIAVTACVFIAALFFWLADSVIIKLLEWIISGLSY